jgi:hypothetical protein
MLPLAEDAYGLSERLTAMGFTAHVPWQKFFESFAANTTELQEYRTYRVEAAKNAIGRPWPMSVFDHSVAYFFSDYVKASFDRRDRDNGVDESQLSTRYPKGESLWRLELTNCDRRRVQLEVQQRDEYERQRARTSEAGRLALRSEVERLSTGVCVGRAAGFGDPVDCYVAAMELHASKLGFHRDAAKSKKGIPIFSREIAGEWDLCWAIEQVPLFVIRPQEGQFTLELQLRSRRLAGPADTVPYDRYLAVRYGQVVPEFMRAYFAFYDFATLETLVRTHLALYELMAPVIEGAIRQSMLH